MRQVWEQLGFLHWPVDAGGVARLLPPGLDVDTLRRRRLRRHRPVHDPADAGGGRSARRIAPAFHEINVRTYVHRGGREPGVWFFSLDATSLLAVAGARVAYRLPYFAADIAMEVTTDPGTGLLAVKYRSRPSPIARRVPRAVPAGRARWPRPRRARSSSSWPSAISCTRGRAAACGPRASTMRRTRCSRAPRATSRRR